MDSRRFSLLDIGLLPIDLNSNLPAGEVFRQMRCPCLRSPYGTFLWLLLVLTSAAATAQEATPADPIDPCEAGPALYRDAQFEAARTALRACLDANGPDVEVLLPLVVMGVQHERLAEAMEYGATAIELAPGNAEARYWYGRALLRSNRPDEAKAQWHAGLSQTVDHLGILEGLARLALGCESALDICTTPAITYTQLPDDRWVDYYAVQLERYRGLYTALKDSFLTTSQRR